MLIPLDFILQNFPIKINGVLHIGAHKLEELESYHKNNIYNIFWIDAIPTLVQEMKNKYKNEKIFCECLSDIPYKEIKFYITNNGQSSSFLKLKEHKLLYPHILEEKCILVKSNTLDNFIKNLSDNTINSVNFLNMDIQGAEYLVLKGGLNFLNQINYIYLEINIIEMYENCKLFQDIKNLLQSLGFICILEKYVDDAWGDALFIRNRKIL